MVLILPCICDCNRNVPQWNLRLPVPLWIPKRILSTHPLWSRMCRASASPITICQNRSWSWQRASCRATRCARSARALSVACSTPAAGMYCIFCKYTRTKSGSWIFCFYCAFSFYFFFCRTNKYNKLVLAQHLDDLVESFLMSALHNGQVRFWFCMHCEAGHLFAAKLSFCRQFSKMFCWRNKRLYLYRFAPWKRTTKSRQVTCG